MWICKVFGHKFKIGWADVVTRLDYCSRCGFYPGDTNNRSLEEKA